MNRKPLSKREAADRWLRLSLYKLRKRDRRKAKLFGFKATEGKTMTETIMLTEGLVQKCENYARSVVEHYSQGERQQDGEPHG